MKIETLILTTNAVQKQVEFYRDIFGLGVLEQTDRRAVFKAGQTRLEFIEAANSIPYHFAFNIPSNKAEEALDWIRDRVDILKDGDNELIDFRSWNAKSLYFYDSDHNVVELIARRNLDIFSTGKFSPEQILGISEIGMPVGDIEQTWHRLNQIGTLPVYSGNFENFCAMGDENGLFIVVDHRQKKWYPTDDPAMPSPFRIGGDFSFEFRDGLIES
jgi:catechol 2,3-dioxygenase-like lactoylglutathione lyase family enzyme